MFKEKTLTTIIRWGIYILLFTPLFITPKTIFPFSFGRVLVIQAIIGILFGFWLGLIYLYPKYRPQKTVLFWAVLIYFGVIFLSSIFGVDFNRSFWGNEERMGGFFTLFHFFILFLITRSVFSGWNDWKKVFSVSVLASVLVSIIALLNRDGILSLWGVVSDGRVSGTIGNPIFLASYLLFHIFIAFLLAIKSNNIKHKAVFILIGFFNVLTLFLTETRGALLGFLFGAFLLVLGYLIFTKSKKLKILLYILLFCGTMFSFLVWLNRNDPGVQKIPGVNRLITLSFEEFSEGTGGTRILTWGVALNAWKESPVFGWGWDNFNIAFNKYYNPKLLKFSVYETWFDRAHNILLDHLVMAGIFGVLSYLFIFAVAFLMLYKFFRQKIIDNHIFIFFVAIFAAHFSQNLFAFNTPISWMMFFLCLSFIDSFNKNDHLGPDESVKFPYVFFVIPVAVILLNFNLYKTSVQAMKAPMLDNAPMEVRVELFKDALKMWSPYKEEIRADLISAVLNGFMDGSMPSEKMEEYFKHAESGMLQNISEHPNHAFYYFILARLYAEMGVYDEIYFKKSEEMFDKSLELSPKRQQIYYGLGKLYLLEKKWDKALEVINIMVQLDPNAAEPYWYLGITLITAGDAEGNVDYIMRGYKEIQKAHKTGYAPKTSSDLTLISTALIELGDYDPIIEIYEEYIVKERIDGAIIKNPSADFCAKVATIYKEKGEFEKAREAALRAAEIDPSFREEAEIFIKLLDN